jgi:hypothetical protein
MNFTVVIQLALFFVFSINWKITTAIDYPLNPNYVLVITYEAEGLSMTVVEQNQIIVSNPIVNFAAQY